MQVPEKLTLIGGSILLASTLVFTLKSQASNILPKVDSGVSSLVNADKSGQSSSGSSNQQNQQQSPQQAEQTFDNNFQLAQQKGQQTGQWGSSKYYIDSNNNLHVGSGQLNGPSHNAIGKNQYESLKTINLDGTVQAPSDSTDLFGADEVLTNYSITAINGLNNLDTSQVTNAYSMFGWLTKATSLDLSHFDTLKVTNMSYMFDDDSSLSNLDLSRFNTSNVTNMFGMLYDNNSIHQLSLGSDTKLQDSQSNNNYNSELSGSYQSNGQTLTLDGNVHPGTWVNQ